MPDYITVPFDTNSADIAQSVFDFVSDEYPDWDPKDAALAVLIITAMSQRAAEAMTLMTMLPSAIFRWAGANLFNTPPVDATPAVGSTTWTALDALGHTVFAPASIALQGPNGSLLFSTIEDIVFDVGDTSVSGVVVVADEDGAEGNDLTGPAVIADADDVVRSVTLQGITAGGADAEEDEDYLNRLARRLRLQAPRPIFASDFADLAMEDPEVFRAVGIDNFIPPASTGQERAVFVAVVKEDGTAVSALGKTRIDTDLQARREWGFIVNVGDFNYHTIDVNFTITVALPFEDAETKTRAEDNVRAFLNAALWGAPSTGELQNFEVQPVMDPYEIATILNNTTGVNRVTFLEFRVDGAAYTSSPVTMTGAVPAPLPGVITGTVA